MYPFMIKRSTPIIYRTACIEWLITTSTYIKYTKPAILHVIFNLYNVARVEV